MISISSIRTYMFCPLKLYLEENMNEKIDNDILLNKTIKELRIDLQDLFQRNLRRIKKEMELSEIEETLSKNIDQYIDNSIAIIENTDKKIENRSIIDNLEHLMKVENKLDDEIEKEIEEEINEEINNEINEKIKNKMNNEMNNELDNQLKNKLDNKLDNKLTNKLINNQNKEENKKEENEADETNKIEDLKAEIYDETYYNMKILALKSQKAMLANDKDGNQITEMFFPSSMYSYLMRDTQLEILGSCDKIEIINGKYYPILLRSGNPPLKGTWDGDSIELVADALLIEQEFDTEVFVGFVDYLKLGERRPVVMDVNLRKSLFRVLNEIKDIIIENIVPEVNITKQKCINCDYKDICSPDDYPNI